MKLIKPGAENKVVTETVKKVADCYGVKPVQGVLMHQMKRYVNGVASYLKWSRELGN